MWRYVSIICRARQACPKRDSQARQTIQDRSLFAARAQLVVDSKV